jgi:predicted DNA binding CopG/RHH family protein
MKADKKRLLTAEERDIEKNADKYRPANSTERTKIVEILERARKGRNINIRIAESDLALIRERSQREGLPYQTLISSVLHKYVTGVLLDADDIRKAVWLVKGK